MVEVSATKSVSIIHRYNFIKHQASRKTLAGRAIQRRAGVNKLRSKLYRAPIRFVMPAPCCDGLFTRDQLCNCGHESFRDDHYGLITPLKGRLIFSYGFLFCLAFVVFENISHTSLVPALGKSVSSFHFRFFFMRRLNATSGLPLNSYAVTTNTLSGFGSRT